MTTGRRSATMLSVAEHTGQRDRPSCAIRAVIMSSAVLRNLMTSGYFFPPPNSFLIQTTIAPNGPAVFM
jgi:hypothetical protein